MVFKGVYGAQNGPVIPLKIFKFRVKPLDMDVRW